MERCERLKFNFEVRAKMRPRKQLFNRQSVILTRNAFYGTRYSSHCC